MPLNRRQLIAVTAAINERRRALLDELRAGTASPDDPAEQADTERDVAELRELDAAGGRLAAGTYGTCADCEGEIEADRLFAQPGALRCIACQRRHEKNRAAPEPSSL